MIETTDRAQLIEVIMREVTTTTDARRFRAWLDTLPIFQLQNWAEALVD